MATTPSLPPEFPPSTQTNASSQPVFAPAQQGTTPNAHRVSKGSVEPAQQRGVSNWIKSRIQSLFGSSTKELKTPTTPKISKALKKSDSSRLTKTDKRAVDTLLPKKMELGTLRRIKAETDPARVREKFQKAQNHAKLMELASNHDINALREMLKTPIGQVALHRFAKQSKGMENIYFLNAVADFKRNPSIVKFQGIIEKFVKPKQNYKIPGPENALAPSGGAIDLPEINIPAPMRKRLMDLSNAASKEKVLEKDPNILDKMKAALDKAEAEIMSLFNGQRTDERFGFKQICENLRPKDIPIMP